MKTMNPVKRNVIVAALGCAFSAGTVGLAAAQQSGGQQSGQPSGATSSQQTSPSPSATPSAQQSTQQSTQPSAEQSTQPSAAQSTQQSTEQSAQQSAQQQQMQQRDVRASEVIGAEVRNKQGEELGEIQDLVMDVQDQRVRYAILSHGGILGVGDKLFAYPVEQFTLGREGKELVLDLPKERLENAPGFDRDAWPDFNEREGYRSQVDSYHQLAQRSPEPGQQGQQQARQAGQSQQTQQAQAQPSAGEPRMVRVSKLLGSNLQGRQGNDAGELEDIVFSLSDSKVGYAVVQIDDSWRRGDDRQAASRTGATGDRTTSGTTTAAGAPPTSAGTTTAPGAAGRPSDTAPMGTTQAERTQPERATAAARGGDLYAVPMDKLQIAGQDQDELKLDMDASQLPQQGFDEDRLENLNDPTFKQQIEQQMDKVR